MPTESFERTFKDKLIWKQTSLDARTDGVPGVRANCGPSKSFEFLRQISDRNRDNWANRKATLDLPGCGKFASSDANFCRHF